jgi:hypothetical protein
VKIKLTDDEIEAIADKYIRAIGGYCESEDGIPYRDIDDFARDVEEELNKRFLQCLKPTKGGD